MAASNLIGGQTETTIQKMLLDSSQFEKGIQDCAKLIRQQIRHEKDLELVRSELEKRTQGLAETNANLTDAVAGVGKSFTVATLAAKGLEVGLRAAHGAMSDLIRRGLEWEEDVKGNEAGIRRMQDAMGGLSDSLVVAGEREKMMKSGLQATEEQLDAVGKAAVVYSRQMNVDVDQALATITERLIGGRGVPRLMRELGIEFTTSGDKATDAIKAMDEMESKFGSMTIAAENTKEAVAEAGAAWDDFKGSLGAWVLQATHAKTVLEELTKPLKEMRRMQGEIAAAEQRRDAAYAAAMARARINDATKAADIRQLGYYRSGIDRERDRLAAIEMESLWQSSGMQVGDRWIPKYDDNDKKTSGKRPELTFAEKRLLQEYELQIETERKANEAAVKLTEARDRAAKDQREFSIWVSEAQARTLRQQVEETNERQAQGRDRWKERKDLLGGSASFLLGADGMRNLDAMISRMDRLNSTMEPGTQLMRELNQASKGFSSTLRELGTGTLVQAYGGILNIADAAIQGKGNLGEMVLELGKSTALGLSQTLLAQGLAASIQASAYAAVPFTWPLAAAYSAQAGIFYTGAATLGAIGLGLSAGQAALSGGGPAPSGGGAVSTGESYRPSYGQREEQQPITVENIVYIGGKADLGAVPWQRAIIQSQVKQRN